MANEFREAAEALYRGEFGLVNTDDLMIGLLARAMEMAAQATEKLLSEPYQCGHCDCPCTGGWKHNPAVAFYSASEVAARVKERIENDGK